MKYLTKLIEVSIQKLHSFKKSSKNDIIKSSAAHVKPSDKIICWWIGIRDAVETKNYLISLHTICSIFEYVAEALNVLSLFFGSPFAKLTDIGEDSIGSCYWLLPPLQGHRQAPSDLMQTQILRISG